jgi:hypothetical protein
MVDKKIKNLIVWSACVFPYTHDLDLARVDGTGASQGHGYESCLVRHGSVGPVDVSFYVLIILQPYAASIGWRNRISVADQTILGKNRGYFCLKSDVGRIARVCFGGIKHIFFIVGALVERKYEK